LRSRKRLRRIKNKKNIIKKSKKENTKKKKRKIFLIPVRKKDLNIRKILIN
jgi:hypothetical protein